MKAATVVRLVELVLGSIACFILLVFAPLAVSRCTLSPYHNCEKNLQEILQGLHKSCRPY